MNKTELIEHIAKHADISKAAATRALESMIGAVKTTLKKGGSVSLVGFGTFAVGKRAALLQGGLHCTDHRLERARGGGLGDVGVFCDVLDQFGLVHRGPSCRNDY